jgi:hypothetical protein
MRPPEPHPVSRPSVIEGAPAQRRPTSSHEGLGIAADDHPSEPFDFAEQNARIRAVCRCMTRLLAATPECDDLTFEGGRRTAPENDLKRLCDTLEALLCRLEVAVDAQRRFVANASHELRMALTLQRTLLETGLAAPDAGGQSLRATCEERRLEHRQPIDVRRLTESALAAHRGEFERRSVTVSHLLAPAAISGDTGLIERLVSNLIDNAVQHNIPGGHIEATTRTEGDQAILTVANSGDAVPADQLDQLLEPFHRLAPRRSADRDRHHGLGLSIVRAIVIAHDASLTVRCHEGGGSP